MIACPGVNERFAAVAAADGLASPRGRGRTRQVQKKLVSGSIGILMALTQDRKPSNRLTLAMEALSRREESDILERGKKDALKACDDTVKGEHELDRLRGAFGLIGSAGAAFADCARGRTVSVLWGCYGKMNEMKGCMRD